MHRLTIIAPVLFALPAWADTPNVITDVSITQGLVAEVLDNGSLPQTLLDAGTDPHHASLKPSRVQALSDADVVVWVGADFAPWMEDVIETTAGNTPNLELLHDGGVDVLALATGAEEADEHGHEEHAHDDHAEDAHDHDEHAHDEHGHKEHGHDEHAHDDHADGKHDHDEHAHDEHAHDDHGHDDHGHDHAGDPHGWLDPEIAAAWVGAIGAALAEADPTNADAYRRNAESAASRMLSLKDELKTELAVIGDSEIVVFHDAYGHFARAFDVKIAGSIALGDATDPGARRLAKLREVVASGNTACVFAEPQHSPAAAEALATDAGIGLGLLDPLGAAQTPGVGHYEATMRAIAASIVDCVERATS